MKLNRKLLSLVLAALLSLSAVPAFAVYEKYEDVPVMSEPIVVTSVMNYTEPTDDSYIGYMEKGEATPENYGLIKVLERMGIQLQWNWYVDSSQYKTKLQLDLASGDYPDVLSVDAATYLYLLDAGVLLDLTEAYEQYASDDLKNTYATMPELLDQCKRDGKLYALPETEDTAGGGRVLYYRKDWADRLGLDAPENLADVIEMIKAFATQDPDGNGVDGDTFGLFAYQNPFSIGLVGLFHSFGVYPDYFLADDEGKLYAGILQPEMLDALKCAQELYAMGAIDPEYATLTNSLMNEDIIAGKAGLYFGSWADGNYPLNYSVQNNPEADWVCMPLLNADGYGYTCASGNKILSYNVAIDTGKANLPEAFMKIMNVTHDIAWQGNGTNFDAYPELETSYWYTWWNPIQQRYPTMSTDQYVALRNAADNDNWEGAISSLSAEEFWKPKYEAYTSGDPVNDPDYWSNWGVWFANGAEDGGWGTIERYRADGHLLYGAFYGPATETEVNFKSTLDDYVDEYVHSFIMGEVGEESWDEFVNTWLNMGGQKWLDEVNAQYAELNG